MKFKTKPLKLRLIAFISIFSLILIGLNCAPVGIVTEKYSEDFYRVEKLLSQAPIQTNPTLIVYSDNQSGWRIRETFLKKSNWLTWKMLIFPFYELYLIGNGIVGTVNWARKMPDYGGKERRFIRDTIYTAAKNSQNAVILNIGDIVANDGRRPAHWATFIQENKIEHPLLNDIPYLPVIGNHEHATDTTYGLANFKAVFDYPRFYVVEFRDMALFVLDSNLLIDQYEKIDDDVQDKLFHKWFVSDENAKKISWLENQLGKSDKPFKIIVMHHPPITFGMHHRDWLDEDNGRNLIEKRHRLLNLFQKYGVRVVLSGHDHLYQHNILDVDEGRKIHFIVGGGGGVPLRKPVNTKKQIKYQQHFKSEGLDVRIARQEEIYHYYIIEVTSNEMTIKVHEVTGKIESPIRLVENIGVKK